MTDPVATLIVDDVLLVEGGILGEYPATEGTVRIDGDLPTVRELIFPTDHQHRLRLLRAGDRVTLAHQDGLPDSVYGGPPSGTIKFATATVHEIWSNHNDAYVVTVTDVEEL